MRAFPSEDWSSDSDETIALKVAGGLLETGTGNVISQASRLPSRDASVTSITNLSMLTSLLLANEPPVPILFASVLETYFKEGKEEQPTEMDSTRIELAQISAFIIFNTTAELFHVKAPFFKRNPVVSECQFNQHSSFALLSLRIKFALAIQNESVSSVLHGSSSAIQACISACEACLKIWRRTNYPLSQLDQALTAPQNHIKAQAHDHPRFRAFAARYGQYMHQLNMRMSVALLRNPDAERRAKEKAEAPTVKTEEQQKRDDQLKQKQAPELLKKSIPFQNIWRRKFRPLPENKAVDLFADVIGDAFILSVAIALIVYETWKSSQKPDMNKLRIEELDQKLEELKKREDELEEAEKKHKERYESLEETLRQLRDPKTNQLLVPALQVCPETLCKQGSQPDGNASTFQASKYQGDSPMDS
ncbi:hypothetical protein FOXB_00201 [Fusarium oxysporum f. sp. conglutinans Fo5176]|uniref:OPA3-like protein n=1 Tax=Fusarium oxysporum (strain Fo5176) TaxID=660025 RepID=F9F1B5_FUSOF|nr:hypothetical protein FOXB_00201 [Fusarium oxysporum f. sp. conglutinans Fo5176]